MIKLNVDSERDFVRPADTQSSIILQHLGAPEGGIYMSIEYFNTWIRPLLALHGLMGSEITVHDRKDKTWVIQYGRE